MNLPTLTARFSLLKTAFNPNLFELIRNRLKVLPTNFGNLSHLETLDLSENYLESLPNISNLQLLKTLIIKKNRISTLPDSLVELKQLKISVTCQDNELKAKNSGQGKYPCPLLF